LGMVNLGHIALDGTKLKASGSKHKAMSYGRMKQEEERLGKEIDELMRQAEVVDAEEDKEFGADHNGYNLPEELQRRELIDNHHRPDRQPKPRVVRGTNPWSARKTGPASVYYSVN